MCNNSSSKHMIVMSSKFHPNVFSSKFHPKWIKCGNYVFSVTYYKIQDINNMMDQYIACEYLYQIVIYLRGNIIITLTRNEYYELIPLTLSLRSSNDGCMCFSVLSPHEQRLLGQGSFLTSAVLVFDPCWDPLRNPYTSKPLSSMLMLFGKVCNPTI